MDGTKRGFTLVEILIAIAILGILSAASFVAINPSERFKQSRDTERVADISNLNTLISQKRYSHVRRDLGNAQVVYISLPDTSATCSSYTLPTLPSGWSYACVAQEDVLNVDGTGWLPVDISESRAMSALPLDPLNTQDYFYAYTIDSNEAFVLTSALESEEKLKGTATTDGGNDDVRFEKGTNLALWSETLSLLGKWNLNDGSGSVAKDASSEQNDGTVYSGVWEQEDCISGGCLSFSGATWVDLGNLGDPNAGTIALWFKKPNINSGAQYFLDGRGTGNWWFLQDYVSGSCTDSNGNACFYGRVQAPSSSFSNNTWHHLVLTTDGSASNIYVDGDLISSGSGLDPNFTSVRVGARYTTTSFFVGTMDEIALYGRALTATEINSLYKAQSE